MIFKRIINRLYELYVGAGGVKLDGNPLYTNAALTRYVQDSGSGISITGVLSTSSDISCVGFIKPSDSGILAAPSGPLALIGRTTESGTAVAVRIGTSVNYTTAGAKVVQFVKNSTTELGYLTKDGAMAATSFVLSTDTAKGVFFSGLSTSLKAASGGTVFLSDNSVNALEATAASVKIATGTTGAGTATVGGAINVNTTAVGNVGADEDNLITYAMPANSLVTTGRGIRIKAWGTTANNANAKTLKLHFESTVILTSSLTTSVAGKWMIEAYVFRTGASAQDYVAKLEEKDANSPDIENGSLTEVESGVINIKVTGEGVSDNDIVQEGMIVEYI